MRCGGGREGCYHVSAPQPAAIGPDDGFNIIYSSGTTGTPKCRAGSSMLSRPPAQAQSAGDWTGAYVGGVAGYGWQAHHGWA